MQAHFNQTLHHIITEAGCTQPRIAIAYSGGLDSTVLLHLCAIYAKQHHVHFIAFHVHHGISNSADQWVEHCRLQCAELEIPFEVAHIQLDNTSDEGVEATARKKRYAALGDLCRRHRVEIILTAHHQDDQAETMLLQLLRGTGIAGLRGMQALHNAEGLLGHPNLRLARPLLDCTRAELESYATQQKISHIDDESNADIRYTRNALRHQIMPLLAQYFPGYQTRFARTAHHAQSALDLLEQLAKQDYDRCRVEAQLNVLALQELPEERIDNALRYWLAAHQIKMPSAARLAEMRKQLLHARDDAQVRIRHGNIELYRYRHLVGLARKLCPPASADSQPTGLVNFRWKGESSLTFPTYFGTLFFDAAEPGEPGINRAWLLEQSLQLRPRQGGERLRLATNRPSRSIKSHYQVSGIPYWQRERLPFVFVGDALLFAAGVGVNGDFRRMEEGGVMLRWEVS